MNSMVSSLFESNDCFDVVSGDFAKPQLTESDYATKIDSWRKKDIKAKRVIATTIGQQPMLHVMKCNTSVEMWNKLHAVYEQKSACSIHYLQQKFYSFVKEPNDDISTHISKIEELVKQLSDLEVEIHESMVVTKILTTLPSELNHFVSAWESISKGDRTIENLRMRLMNEESRCITHNVAERGEALVARRFDNRKQAKKNYSPKSKKEPGKCHVCYSGFHWRRDCPKLKNEKTEKTDKGYSLISRVKCNALIGCPVISPTVIKSTAFSIQKSRRLSDQIIVNFMAKHNLVRKSM